MQLVLCIVVTDVPSFLAVLAQRYGNLFDGRELTVSGVVFELDLCEADDRIPDSFRYAADRVDPSLDERDFAELEDHGGVIYTVSPEFESDDEAFATSQAGLTVAAIAADCGAMGIKCESSGIAHHPRRWITLQAEVGAAFQQRRAGDVDAGTRLFASMIGAFVRLPIQSGRHLHTCGMHLLGRPEVAVEDMEPAEAAVWLKAFALYQTALAPPEALIPGEGFRLTVEGERRILHHVDEAGWYPQADLFHNPWGVWFLQLEAQA